jgi:hypothetical protein
MSTIRYRRIMPAIFSPSKLIRKEWIASKEEDNHEMDWWVSADEPAVEIDPNTFIGQRPICLVFEDPETNEVYEQMYICRSFNVNGRISKYVEAEELDNELVTVFLNPQGQTVQAYRVL